MLKCHLSRFTAQKMMFLKSSLFHNVVAMMLSLLVAACGGGGGGGSTNQNNPLEKYAGTYYACDKNEKTSLQLTASGQNNLAAQLSADVYSGPNCTGEIIGSYRQNGSSVVSYVSTGNSDLPALTIFPSSDTIDYVTLAIPAGTGMLTGNGVTGNCVNYSYMQGSSSISGSHCYDLVQQPATVTGGLYLSSDAQYLVQFQRVDGVYQAEKIISRNSSFDVESLIQDSSGGGSGGPTPPVAPTFNLAAAYTSAYSAPSSADFRISGSYGLISITGAGNETVNDFSTGYFEGQAAQRRTTTISGSYQAIGNPYPLNISQVLWMNSDYSALGFVDNEYAVIAGSYNLPTSVQVGGEGNIYTANRFSDATKSIPLGTVVSSYLVQADSSTTALVTLTQTYKNMADVVERTNSTQYRITLQNTLTRIKNVTIDVGSNLRVTLTY